MFIVFFTPPSDFVFHKRTLGLPLLQQDYLYEKQEEVQNYLNLRKQQYLHNN